MRQNWRQQHEQGTLFMLVLIRWIALRLGRRAGRVFLWPISVYFLLRLPGQRRASHVYLTRILARKASWLDIGKHIHTFAATILDRVFFLTGQYEYFDIRLTNEDVVLKQAESGQGCLLLGSHLGSFEALRTLGVKSMDLPIKVLMDPAHNQNMIRVLNALNPEIAQTVIAQTGPAALLKVKECTDRGDLVGLLGDRVADNSKITTCQFLGKSANFPVGPILLAHSLRIPVILFFALYRGGNRYDIVFELLARRIVLERSDKERQLQQWTQQYANRLAYHAKQAPYNWFNFYDFWQELPIKNTV